MTPEEVLAVPMDPDQNEGTHPGSSAGWPECWWIADGS